MDHHLIIRLSLLLIIRYALRVPYHSTLLHNSFKVQYYCPERNYSSRFFGRLSCITFILYSVSPWLGVEDFSWRLHGGSADFSFSPSFSFVQVLLLPQFCLSLILLFTNLGCFMKRSHLLKWTIFKTLISKRYQIHKILTETEYFDFMSSFQVGILMGILMNFLTLWMEEFR